MTAGRLALRPLPRPRPLSLAAGTLGAATGAAGAVVKVVGRATEGRAQRRSWFVAGKAHIEVRGVQRPGTQRLAAEVEAALGRLEGVRWAKVDDVLGRVVVAADPEGPSVDRMVAVVAAVEEVHGTAGERFPHDRPEHPADVEPLRRTLLALGADVAGLGLGVVGQLLRATPLPVELASLLALVDNQPRVRHLLERHLGVPATEIGLGLTSALAQALTQGPTGLIVDMVSRASSARELHARRAAWCRREPDLAASPERVWAESCERGARPRPLPDGPVERVAERAALGAAAAFAVTLGLTASPRRAAAALSAAVPKAGRLGREAFAAELGRAFAARNLVVMDRTVLRRLDRVDTLVVDVDAACTGRGQLGDMVVVDGSVNAAEVARRTASLFDGQRPDRTSRRGTWKLAPLDRLLGTGAAPLQLPRGARTRIRQAGRSRTLLGVVHHDRLVALVPVEPELHPLAQPLLAAARRHRLQVVVADGRRQLADRLGGGERTAGGRRLAGSVRALQGAGRVVALVSGANQSALEAADCSIGVPGAGCSPWAADIITEPGLSGALAVVEAVGAARLASRLSATLAVAGSGAGALWSFTSPVALAAGRATLPVNAAALAAQVTGTATAAMANRRPAPAPMVSTPWHAMDGEAVLRAVGSTEEGLAGSEAARRLTRPVQTPSLARRLTRAVTGELANPLTPVLATGAGLAAAVGSLTDAALVGGVTAANAVIGGVQRLRADVSIDRLVRSATMTVPTRRDGRTCPLDAAALVRGDVVELSRGSVVPADCRVLTATALEVDESVLTGESLPVTKQAEAVVAVAVGDRSSMLYEGTTVVAGSALAVVVATGSDTEMGRSLADAPQPPPSGVESRLAQLTALTVPVTLASGAAVTGLGLLHGRDPRRALVSGVSLTVAAVPEGLPLLSGAAQLAAAHRLSARGALVRNPRTIEALGRVDVLCFDKTGTLTAGRLALQRVSDGAGACPLHRLDDRRRMVLAAAVRATPVESGSGVVSQATDVAVMEGADAAGVEALDVAAVGPRADGVEPHPDGAAGGTHAPPGVAGGNGSGSGRWQPLGELPFASERGFHAVVGTIAGEARVSVKGAPEVVLPRCRSWLSPDGPILLQRPVRRRLEAEVERLAAGGLRVLAVAERPASRRPELHQERVRELQLLGFVALADAVRPTAAAAVGDLRRAGVDVVMITGDHPATARAVAADLDLDGTRLLTGADLDTLSDEELQALAGDVAVFARVTPAHKLRIVRALQRQGKVVAMTGDGANDAPAIRLAHTGIALGARSSPAARHAADVVVVDDRIETIIDAIVEGRALWAAVRDAVAILVGGNLGEVGFTVAATAATGASPLAARQLLLVNLLTDMLPAMTIALRPPNRRSPEDLLHEGPDASLGAALQRQIALRAATTGIGAGAAWLAGRATGRRRRASTVALGALVGTQLAQTALVGRSSPLVVLSTAVSAAALVGVVQTPGVSQFFGCTPLGPVGWGIATVASFGATAGSVLAPAATRALGRRLAPPAPGPAGRVDPAGQGPLSGRGPAPRAPGGRAAATPPGRPRGNRSSGRSSGR